MTSLPKQLQRSEEPPARQSPTPVRVLAGTAVDAVLDKKGLDVVVMDMTGISGVADVFVLATGESDLQIKAMADAVVASIREEHGERPWHKEGYEHRQWILLDYVDLVVHVFNGERREFYALERLWGDAPREEVNPDGTASDVKLLQA
ncbi:MAG: ribosome silencing factor [Rhodothermales bacterium]|nr:ribosome silencing factor [Rhodothermales bacterium]MBO6780377.1 ribosome silencing factor [Rhodothermales bacterium]